MPKDLILKIKKLKATDNPDREAISDGIFLADGGCTDAPPLAVRTEPVREGANKYHSWSTFDCN